MVDEVPRVVERPKPTVVEPEGRVHESFKIIFERPGTGETVSTLGANSVLENARIRWGRESLFDPPMRRTLSFTARMGRGHGPEEMRNWRVLRVRAKWGPWDLFVGQIDSISFDLDYKFTTFTATEAPRWDPFLRETSRWYEMSIDAARRVVEKRYTLDPLPVAVYPEPRYPVSDRHLVGGRYEFTGEQLVRLAVAPYPASFIQWKPNGHVGCTMASNETSLKPIEISHRHIEEWPVSIRLEDTPFRVAMQSAKAWTPELERAVAYFHDEAVRFQHAKIDSFKDWGPYRELDNGINFSGTADNGLYIGSDLRPSENVFFKAADIIRGQITSPPKLTFDENLLPDNSSALLFVTWEQHRNVYISAESDFFRSQYRVIGGILNVAHGRTTHETTALWAQSHPDYGYPNESDVEMYTVESGEDDQHIPF